MRTRKGITEWLLENCVDRNGDLNLSLLDFSAFDGDVYISQMKVKESLYQDEILTLQEKLEQRLKLKDEEYKKLLDILKENE
jgi:hypothetical protein